MMDICNTKINSVVRTFIAVVMKRLLCLHQMKGPATTYLLHHHTQKL
eukprot:UN00694